MQRIASRRLAAACTCRTLPISTRLPVRWSSSSAIQEAEQSSPLPWFVEQPLPTATSSPSDPTSSTSTSSSTLKPTQAPSPPSDIPTILHGLHSHLSLSPFLDHESLSFINAREADPDGAWTDWVIVATLRRGRERSLKGAVEGIKTFITKNPIQLDERLQSIERPFSPTSPIISGLPTPPSRHARSRQGASPSTRADQATGWGMLDCGDVVIHVMTAEARINWGIEQVWDRVKRQNDRLGNSRSPLVDDEDE